MAKNVFCNGCDFLYGMQQQNLNTSTWMECRSIIPIEKINTTQDEKRDLSLKMILNTQRQVGKTEFHQNAKVKFNKNTNSSVTTTKPAHIRTWQRH
jgi:hypothetical protein